MSWIYYNPNPDGRHVGDCTIRAITKATGESWETVYSWLTAFGYMLKDMPSANHVWGKCLRSRGFKRYLVDDQDDDRYTVTDFCNDNPVGTYVLAIPGHVVTVVNGDYFDSWDSGQEVPQYYWTRCEDEHDQMGIE